MKILLVSAAILLNQQNKILLTQRPVNKAMAGYWEFPGGKIEEGETPENALIRELQEELAVIITKENLFPFTFASHTYENFHLLMPIFTCSVWKGTITSKEKQDFSWVKISELENYPLLPADIPVVKMIQQVFTS